MSVEDLPPGNKEKLVKISEAAQILGVSIDTVRRWDKKGILHSTRPDGKNRYFSIEELEKIKFSRPLTSTQAAHQLGISVDTLRRLEERNIIKPERNEKGERVYTRATLEKYLDSEYFLRHKKVQEEVLEPLKQDDGKARVTQPRGSRGQRAVGKAEEKAVASTDDGKVFGAVLADSKRDIRRLDLWRRVLARTGLVFTAIVVLLIGVLTVAFLQFVF